MYKGGPLLGDVELIPVEWEAPNHGGPPFYLPAPPQPSFNWQPSIDFLNWLAAPVHRLPLTSPCPDTFPDCHKTYLGSLASYSVSPNNDHVGFVAGVAPAIHIGYNEEIHLDPSVERGNGWISDLGINHLMSTPAIVNAVAAVPHGESPLVVFMTASSIDVRIDNGKGSQLRVCQNIDGSLPVVAEAAEHYYAIAQPLLIPYAITPECASSQPFSFSSSHEIVESITDAENPDGWIIPSPAGAWSGLTSGDSGGEVADLCEEDPSSSETGVNGVYPGSYVLDGYTVAKYWVRNDHGHCVGDAPTGKAGSQ